VNLRVLTEAAITNSNEVAKHASVDGIQLEEGDIIRAYATYSANGIACDTAIHTFNAPDLKEMRMVSEQRRNRGTAQLARNTAKLATRLHLQPTDS